MTTNNILNKFSANLCGKFLTTKSAEVAKSIVKKFFSYGFWVSSSHAFHVGVN